MENPTRDEGRARTTVRPRSNNGVRSAIVQQPVELAHYVAFDEVVRAPRPRWNKRIEAVSPNPDFASAVRSLVDDFIHSAEGLLAGVDRLGQRFELGEELGRGASAVVWSAEDRARQQVCLKVFRPFSGAQCPGELASREARQTLEPISPHIIQTHGVGHCHETGLHFIVMELCSDRSASLHRPARCVADTRPRDLREAIGWVQQAARGLEAAHARDVFHGDIKPENVLIRPVSRSAVVIDFGLWCTLAPSPTKAPGGSARPSVVQGTPAYMAPEQARGIPADADPTRPEDRALMVGIDVYGLGALLYELCAGAPPYRAARFAAAPTNELLLQAQTRRAPLPACTTDAALQDIVSRATAPLAAERYPSCGALAAELGRYLERSERASMRRTA